MAAVSTMPSLEVNYGNYNIVSLIRNTVKQIRPEFVKKVQDKQALETLSRPTTRPTILLMKKGIIVRRSFFLSSRSYLIFHYMRSTLGVEDPSSVARLLLWLKTTCASLKPRRGMELRVWLA